ncbi:MAG: HAD family hydrolase [Bacilli bacterium]|nr:HAD family hydrolase [Bacilli bacterium]
MNLLVFDVDGTLLPFGQEVPSEETIAAVSERLAKGDAVAIASGRPFPAIKRFLEMFGPGEKYVIAANGAAVYDIDGNVIDINGITVADFHSFVKRHCDLIDRGAHIYCYMPSELGYYYFNESVEWEINCNHFPGRDLNKHPTTEDAALLKMMVSASPSLIDSIVLDDVDKKFNVLRTDPHYLEFMNPKADKATATETVRLRLGLNKEHVYTFGDQGNDLRMIKEYQGVAMGNAIDDVKKVAKYITKKDSEDGIAFALRNFLKN